MPESLIPEETLAMVGQSLGKPSTATITADGARRYALAVGETNPLYFDEEAAKAAGYRTLLAPPTYLNYAIVRDGRLEDIRTDGLYGARSSGPGIRLRVSRNMFGGEEWDWLLPVYVGDTVTATSRLKSLEEKSGGSGPFVLTTRETTFENQDGEVVARSRQLSIAR